MNSNQYAFRDSFRGYNKDDVNSYIADQYEMFADKEADYKKEITDLRTENNLLHEADAQLALCTEKLTQAEENAANLNAELETARQHEAALAAELEECKAQLEAAHSKENAEIEEALNTLREKLSASEAVIAALNEANQELNEQCRTLRETCDTTEKDTVNDKAQIYDQISQQIGSLILDARSNAEEIVKRAQASAAEILERASAESNETHRLADEYADHVRRDADARMQQACNSINETLRKLTGDCVADYSQRLAHCKASIDAVISEFRSATDQANLRMESLLTTRGHEIKTMIDSVTNLPDGNTI